MIFKERYEKLIKKNEMLNKLRKSLSTSTEKAKKRIKDLKKGLNKDSEIKNLFIFYEKKVLKTKRKLKNSEKELEKTKNLKSKLSKTYRGLASEIKNTLNQISFYNEKTESILKNKTILGLKFKELDEFKNNMNDRQEEVIRLENSIKTKKLTYKNLIDYYLFLSKRASDYVKRKNTIQSFKKDLEIVESQIVIKKQELNETATLINLYKNALIDIKNQLQEL